MGHVSIGIIGLGWVGASTAISILQRGICQELLLCDSKPGLAEGEAMDLNHGSSFYPTARVKAVDISEMKHCNAIVITAGRGGKPNESRLDLLNDNIRIAQSIAEQLKGFQGILVIVANPVDVLTYYYQKFSGLPPGRVIGTGTMLDTARLREIIGRKLGVDPRSIHAQVVGEHGDSETILWSTATIAGMKLRDWNGWLPAYEEEIADQVKKAAYEIIRRKGATNHAIGLVTATLLKWVLRGEKRVINLSTVISGPYGLQDVALSLPALVSNHGVLEILEVGMSMDERTKFLNSASIIRKAIESVQPSTPQ
ncbi:MAG: L-lactate dehydrogenase [Haliscomenobacter sp.]|nr:L-lactate dehydrogenase [Haliscomenobacter sp.]